MDRNVILYPMKLSEWARGQGISYRTAWRWFKAGTLPAPAEQAATGTILVKPVSVPPGAAALYARVSSSGQKKDLEGQIGRLVAFANARGLAISRSVFEIGPGLNGRRPKLLKLLADPVAQTIVVEHRDRLMRFGSEYVEAALAAQGRRLVVAEPERGEGRPRAGHGGGTHMVLRQALRPAFGAEPGPEGPGRRRGEMIAQQAFRYELDPHARQRMLLAKHAGTARFAWNWALGERMRRYRECLGGQRFTNAIEQHRQLNARKATEWPWMYEVSKCAPQEALRDLDRAFGNFVLARKASRYCGFPRFKRKGVDDAFRLTGSIRVLGRAVQLPRLGAMRTKEGTEKLRGRILSATVRREADRWYVSLTVETERANPEPI